MPHEHPIRGSGTETEMRNLPNPYVVHRDFDPKAGNPDAIPFELTERERSLAAQWKCQLERNRRELNRREMSQAHVDAAVDAMVRGGGL